MTTLTHKTTLLLSRGDYILLREISKSTGKTLGALIREAVLKMYGKKPAQDVKRAWSRLYKAKAPVSDWAEMEREIEKGRLS